MTAYELAEKAEGLAYEIPADWSSGEPKNVATDIAAMLRQQADRIAELENKLSFYEIKDLDSGLKPKPLSDEEIDKIIYSVDWAYNPVLLVRAIEERHGIK